MARDSRISIKVVVVGESFVGKTSLIERFAKGTFTGVYRCTIGGVCNGRSLNLGEKQAEMHVWDTAGTERYRSLNSFFYRGANAAVVCYDLTDGASWAQVNAWIKDVKDSTVGCDIYLVGCKRDLVLGSNCFRRQVCEHRVREFASDLGVSGVFETSSQTGENVEEVFQLIGTEIIDKLTNSADSSTDEEIVKLSRPNRTVSTFNCCGKRT